MKVALCCIGRLENQYAVEYVEHYKKLGFDKIFIYDNNHDGEERFEDVLQTFIDDGFVEVIDFRDKETAQLSAYNDCYSRYGNDYDWIAFFDFDEFLTLVEDKDIKAYLGKFDGFDCIKVNWMMYTDNGLVVNDKRPLMDRFVTPMEYDKCVGYGFPENNHVKSIVRGRIGGFRWTGTPHTPNINIRYCTSSGKECDGSPFQEYDFTKAYIKHFMTKTIDEWINNKRIRGVGDRSYATFNETYDLDGFFKINDKTDEKVRYINGHDLNIFICTHQDFEKAVSDSCYKVVDIRESAIREYRSLDDKFYSELLAVYNVGKRWNLPKYIGFCHYRRYFSFMDDIPNMDMIFSRCDAIVANPLVLDMSVREQYAKYHNIEDLEIVEGIIKEKYQDYYGSCETILNGNTFIPYNMFIMKTEMFPEYIEFVFGVLDEYLNVVGTDIVKRIEDNKDKYLKDFEPNNTIEYQYRIGGYLAERLTNIFIMRRLNKIMLCDVIITENKYNLEINNI